MAVDVVVVLYKIIAAININWPRPGPQVKSCLIVFEPLSFVLNRFRTTPLSFVLKHPWQLSLSSQHAPALKSSQQEKESSTFVEQIFRTRA
jgi:hypothetical protein